MKRIHTLYALHSFNLNRKLLHQLKTEAPKVKKPTLAWFWGPQSFLLLLPGGKLKKPLVNSAATRMEKRIGLEIICGWKDMS